MSNQHFIDQCLAEAMQTLGNLPQPLPAAIAEAGLHLAQRLIAGQKIVVIGCQSLAPLSQLFCSNQIYRDADLRPALPVISLNNGDIAAAIGQGEAKLAFCPPLQAIGQPGDALLLLCEDALSEIVASTLDCAHNQQMNTVVVGKNSAQCSAQYNLQLPLEIENLTRMHEITLFILNSLNDMIDQQLFGDH